jgi:phage tail-like protein
MTDWLPGKKDQLASYTFMLEVDGITEATFRECSGLSSETSIIESKETGNKGQTVIKKMPGALKWGDITLKRGFTDDMKLYEWRQKVVDGKLTDMRKNGSIVVYDYENKETLPEPERRRERCGNRGDHDLPRRPEENQVSVTGQEW